MNPHCSDRETAIVQFRGLTHEQRKYPIEQSMFRFLTPNYIVTPFDDKMKEASWENRQRLSPGFQNNHERLVLFERKEISEIQSSFHYQFLVHIQI